MRSRAEDGRFRCPTGGHIDIAVDAMRENGGTDFPGGNPLAQFDITRIASPHESHLNQTHPRAACSKLRISSHSAEVDANGFSHRTGFRAAIQALTYWAWVASLEAIITPSTSSESMRFSADGSAFAPGTREAIFSARRRSISAIARTCAPAFAV